MKKILVALSLNEDYQIILAYACWLSNRLFNANLELISVADYSLTPPSYLIPYIEKELQQSKIKLSKISETLQQRGIDSNYTLIKGRLIESFNKAICELKADFMVLGYKSHIIRASSSEKMIKTLNIPMLVVRGKKSESLTMDSLKIKNILCVTDFSDNSWRAIQLIETLYETRAEPINLTIANVISKSKIDKLFNNIEMDDSLCKEKYCEALREERYSKLENINIVGLDIKKVCTIGVPYKVINEIAVETDADLIFMGAKGITSVEGIRIGSVSESVIKSSPCPVVLVT